jgi:hypothetical protein
MHLIRRASPVVRWLTIPRIVTYSILTLYQKFDVSPASPAVRIPSMKLVRRVTSSSPVKRVHYGRAATRMLKEILVWRPNVLGCGKSM